MKQDNFTIKHFITDGYGTLQVFFTQNDDFILIAIPD